MHAKPLPHLAWPVLLAISLLLTACHGNSAAAYAAPAETAEAAAQAVAAAGPPAIHPITKSRMPRPCPFIDAPPTAAQAAILLQCTMDIALRDSTDLMQHVSATIGASHPLDESIFRVAEKVDTRQPVYNITASATYVTCIDASIAPNTNCSEHYFVNAPGYCYKLVGKGWRCSLLGKTNSDAYKGGLPPPTTY